ncbi:hypothetical protein NZ698_14490 [Chryseobacterium sp. PBS4-4]|uniref:Baseplate protein J-like domain-containing protein n=1 Tax=Chryseobacterium edaphi TaxID=2976532 RepID=A0ABT2W8T8_9FLAO|nr:hypothetical protein [Chryseobacterium edaphi]MCU7618405.1 hypothetical protein [Chryseobacterium edaphi]
MEPLYSLLTFPQYFKEGYLYYNIMVLPRNINLYNSLGDNLPPFVDVQLSFETKIINHLDGLPIAPNVTHVPDFEILSEINDKNIVYREIIQQIETADQLKISDDVNENNDGGFSAQKEKFKNISIRKYLPQSYRNSFNFTSSRTKFAITDDQYECSIKNKEKIFTDEAIERNHISWGKLIAFIIRNPLLAEKAGLIYKVRTEISRNSLFLNGGWLYTTFAAEHSYSTLNSMIYACRIPKLKDKERQIFAPVLFPVKSAAENNATYDSVMQESILYNDGFAKIVHANQPVNQDLLQENDHSNPPLKDIGIRLGWDDEQLTIWGNRQLKQKDEVTDLPIDAPLGVFGYKIDVRKKDTEAWSSQNLIFANQNISFGNQLIIPQNHLFELPVEVHPSSHGNTINEGFWLPMYYASWCGNSMVIPDKEAQEVHQLTADKLAFDETLGAENALNTVPKRTYNPYQQDSRSIVPLLYGEDYEFRIRLMDISGGGPSVSDNPLNGGQNPVGKVHFIRNIAASALKIENAERFYQGQSQTKVNDMSILENILDEDNTLIIRRPDLSYPSVVYTGKYSDAATLLKNRIENISAPQNLEDRKEYIVGLPDPDVNTFKVIVEVKSLEMDNALSENGKESYIFLKEKTYQIPNDTANENYDLSAKIKIFYKDIKILNIKSLNEELNEISDNELFLPTSRHLRITFIPLVDNADEKNDYASEFIREGKKIIFTSFRSSQTEKNLLSEINGGLRAFYLQPEKTSDRPANLEQKEILKKSLENGTSVELQRLADALNLTVKNLTLEGLKGTRAQFGVSNQFRHSLSPDSGSVSFSSVKELFNHWIVAVDFTLNRDWFWDDLKINSFTVIRSVIISGQKIESQIIVGNIDMKDTASISMLQGDVDRSFTRILFLDVIDPEQLSQKFPREIFAEYTLVPNFKENYPAENIDNLHQKSLELPITIIPHQIPKMISAGLAMSSYQYDEEYYKSSVERQKYLWFEFETPPDDPEDTYFARILAHSPDPYLCRVDENLISNVSEDLPFALNEEKIREIIPNMTNDYAGIGVMQELIPETSSDGTKTYLLPLPSGLHANSDELFGFFTYEIRLGHKKESWSTAQGRYGRPLKVNGVQHPAPELVCNVYRSERIMKESVTKYLEISAPFANAVLNGKNISSFPPTTSLWYLMYTQVMQADGKSFRNILVDSGPMMYRPKRSKRNEKQFERESGNRLGKARILLSQIGNKLEELGLSKTNTLSVIAVEMFPMDSRWQHTIKKERKIDDRTFWDQHFMNEYMEEKKIINPLTDQLGRFRIYRTSVLTPVSETCCEDC